MGEREGGARKQGEVRGQRGVTLEGKLGWEVGRVRVRREAARGREGWGMRGLHISVIYHILTSCSFVRS